MLSHYVSISKGLNLQMDGSGLDVSSGVSLKITTISECHNNSGSSSSCSLFSENVNGETPATAPDTSQHLSTLKVNTDWTTEVPKVNDLGCDGDNVSCISKADGTNLEIGGHSSDTGQKNVTGSSPSVDSFCQEGSKNPIHIQSVKHGSISSKCIAEEGNKFRGSPEYVRDAVQSAADASDRSDPSETSSFRDEHFGAVSPKVESFSPARDTDLLTKSQKRSHDCINLLETDAGTDGNKKIAVTLNKLDEKQHSEMRKTNDVQGPPSQCCVIKDDDDLDELVDVRVCDICGDVGREALLAICSNCGDGAEHIYCMRIKMDKVPEGDWICEECMIMAQAQKQKADERKIGKGLQKSSTNEIAQIARKSNRSGDNGRVKMGNAFIASGKRPGDNIEISPSTKKRVLENDIKLQIPSGSYAKGLLPRHDNLNIMAKHKVASSSGCSPLGNVVQSPRQPLTGKSSNVESQFRKRSLLKQKCSKITDIRTKKEREDVYREQKIVKGSPTFRAGQLHTLAKLRKSKSFTASTIASIDTSDSKKNMESDFKVTKLGNKRGITQRSYSFNSKTSQPVSPVGVSNISRVKSAKVTPMPGEATQQVAQKDSYDDSKTAEVCGDLERATIPRIAKRQCDRNGSGVDKKMLHFVGDKGRNPGNFGRTSTGCAGQKEQRKIANVEADPNSTDSKHQLNDTDNVQLTPGRIVLLAASAHPNSDCVWRGMFNVKDCNKLQTTCSRLQAHLSTCASPKAYEVVSKLPCEIAVKEVLQQEIWPSQFLQNGATEDNIALYFFAEDFESYRIYRRFLNCMMLNDLALKSDLNGVELLIFPSHILPARSQRWNNLFFLWGVFRAKRSSFPDDVCVPSPCKAIQNPMSDAANSPQHPAIPIPAASGPRNSNVSAEGDGGSPTADTRLEPEQGSVACSSKELQSSFSTKSKCTERSSVNEFTVKTLSDVAISPQHPSIPIPAASGPRNSNVSAEVDGGSSTADTRLEPEQGSGSCSSKELQSLFATKTKCMERSSVNEVAVKTLLDVAISPRHPPRPIPAASGPKNLNISAEVGRGPTVADAPLGREQGSGSADSKELQSSFSTKSKCMENEVAVKTLSDVAISPQRPPILIAAASGGRISNISAAVGGRPTVADAPLGREQGSGYSNSKEFQSSSSTKSKCKERRSVNEVADKTLSDVAISPQRPPIPIPAVSRPRNSKISAEGGGEPTAADAADAPLGREQGSGSSNLKELQSSFSTKSKCMEGSSANEVDVKTLASAPMERDQHPTELLTTTKAQKENRCQNLDPDETDGSPISLNSFPSDSGGMEISERVMDHGGSIDLNSPISNSEGAEEAERFMDHHALDLELSLWSERRPPNGGDLDMVHGLPNGNAGDADKDADGLVSLNLSLALPSKDKDPVPMMEELIPDKDDVDTSLFLFYGDKKA